MSNLWLYAAIVYYAVCMVAVVGSVVVPRGFLGDLLMAIGVVSFFIGCMLGTHWATGDRR